jgi:ribosomal protein L11 methyltransferase
MRTGNAAPDRTALWKVSVTTSPEAEDAATELLESLFHAPAVSYTNFETGHTTVEAYLEHSLAKSSRHELTLGLKRIKSSGLRIGSGRISCQIVRKENWAESWKRHFKPIEIGSALLVKTGWSCRRPRRGQAVVVLDPGLSFGTGQHPTTAFCLEQLVAHRRPGREQPFLDIGTGSGILAIAAARLGYAPVDAFDCDPEAVRIARANARQNRVQKRIRISQQDLQSFSRRGPKYAIICANLLSTLLLSERDRLLARLAPDGILILAGILRSEFHQIQSAYENRGLQLVARRTKHEWTSGAFCQR